MKNGRLNQNGDSAEQDRSEADLGRESLAAWKESQPDNFFAYDLGFQRSLEFLWGRDTYKQHAGRLFRFGSLLASTVDGLVEEASRDQNQPRLERYDPIGERIERVIYHPAHHDAGRMIFDSGMMSVFAEPGNNLLALAMFYLSAQNGEAGHNCSLACTAGMIKVLQAVGSDKLKRRYLPHLLDSNYDTLYQGAQFLTEIQGGSDVGANAMLAKPLELEKGLWLLSGEKWFCSNISADLALVTARVADQGSGTRGLGLFLMPRGLENGQPNAIRINRLKEKLGTRGLATAEVEFQGALAHQLGPLDQGFKNLMTFVINTSRVYNALAVCGAARRVYITAKTFAQNRRAFGQAIIHYPLVQDTLANMRADSSAILAGSLHIVNLVDKLELGDAGNQARDFLRLAINLNKYRSAILTREIIAQGIELLGGNGTIESFSILPRLLRDNFVYENWEGTHNVLLAQVQRDIRRYQISEPFLLAIESMFLGIEEESLRVPGLEEQAKTKNELTEVLAMDELTAAIFFRPLMNRITDLYYAACLAAEGEWELREKKDRTKLRLAKLFFDKRVLGREPKDIPYYDDQVSRLCH